MVKETIPGSHSLCLEWWRTNDHKTPKAFVDGDSWLSDMSKLGENVGISDTLCLDSIKVVPNHIKLVQSIMKEVT